MPCDCEKVCDSISNELKKLIIDEVSDKIKKEVEDDQCAIFDIALEWIKKQKGMDHKIEWFIKQ